MDARQLQEDGIPEEGMTKLQAMGPLPNEFEWSLYCKWP